LFNPCDSCSLNLALYELISCCLSSLHETLLSLCVPTGYQGFILLLCHVHAIGELSFQAIMCLCLNLSEKRGYTQYPLTDLWLVLWDSTDLLIRISVRFYIDLIGQKNRQILTTQIYHQMSRQTLILIMNVIF
jgi:hypothetical protein